MNRLITSLAALVTAAYCALSPAPAKADWHPPSKCYQGSLQPRVQIMTDDPLSGRINSSITIWEDNQVIRVDYSEAADLILNKPLKIEITPCNGEKEGPQTELTGTNAEDYFFSNHLGEVRGKTLKYYAAQFLGLLESKTLQAELVEQREFEVRGYIVDELTFRVCDEACEDIGGIPPARACLDYKLKRFKEDLGSAADSNRYYHFSVTPSTEYCADGKPVYIAAGPHGMPERIADGDSGYSKKTGFSRNVGDYPYTGIVFGADTLVNPIHGEYFEKVISAFDKALSEKAKPQIGEVDLSTSKKIVDFADKIMCK